MTRSLLTSSATKEGEQAEEGAACAVARSEQASTRATYHTYHYAANEKQRALSLPARLSAAGNAPSAGGGGGGALTLKIRHSRISISYAFFRTGKAWAAQTPLPFPESTRPAASPTKKAPPALRTANTAANTVTLQRSSACGVASPRGMGGQRRYTRAPTIGMAARRPKKKKKKRAQASGTGHYAPRSCAYAFLAKARSTRAAHGAARRASLRPEGARTRACAPCPACATPTPRENVAATCSSKTGRISLQKRLKNALRKITCDVAHCASLTLSITEPGKSLPLYERLARHACRALADAQRHAAPCRAAHARISHCAPWQEKSAPLSPARRRSFLRCLPPARAHLQWHRGTHG